MRGCRWRWGLWLLGRRPTLTFLWRYWRGNYGRLLPDYPHWMVGMCGPICRSCSPGLIRLCPLRPPRCSVCWGWRRARISAFPLRPIWLASQPSGWGAAARVGSCFPGAAISRAAGGCMTCSSCTPLIKPTAIKSEATAGGRVATAGGLLPAHRLHRRAAPRPAPPADRDRLARSRLLPPPAARPNGGRGLGGG